MAYINVAEWKTDQVTEWLKGLDDSMSYYVYSFTNNRVDGRQLLHIRPYELEQLGMFSIGHQEILLAAVENLRNFHYNLDKENLQFMALHVATSAGSLHRQLAIHCDASKIETHILNDITRTISTIKPLISWLDRAPFYGQVQFTEICRNMLRLGLEMATIAQRDRFVERPVEQIKKTAEKLERLANYIIQDITDPMLLQPASLNLVTLKKRESELGVNIEPSYQGIHRVTDIKYNSPAHNSGKIEVGDEIVQINYQTVVGWQYKTVLFQLRESLPDVLLTLKKRPKHTKIYGQIYMQPYRLPSKKRTIGARWGENLPSPRAGFLTVPDGTSNIETTGSGPTAGSVSVGGGIVGIGVSSGSGSNLDMEEKSANVAGSSDTDSSCSDILTPTDAKTTEKQSRLFNPKPRALLQRRNTISGDELLGHKAAVTAGHVPLWLERKGAGNVADPVSPSLRDKSVSFGFGLEIAPRPTTCIGLAGNTSVIVGEPPKKSKAVAIVECTPESRSTAVSSFASNSTSVPASSSKPGVSKVVRFDAHMKVEDYPLDEKYTCNVQNTILETYEPILFADEDEAEEPETEEDVQSLQSLPSMRITELATGEHVKRTHSIPLAEAVNQPMVARRGRLDKSHSTPAYDNSGESDDVVVCGSGVTDSPPAVEPRKEFLLQTPPVPPPRPRKQLVVPPPPPKPPGLLAQLTAAAAATASTAASTATTQTTLTTTTATLTSTALSCSDVSNIVQIRTIEPASELVTPTKTRTLTLKKKHSLMAKRRNINLQILGTGDIQGHLYRRTKDRRGVTFWARLYFVMLDTILYGFRSKESPKASCVIFLPGFTVSPAKEVHSKPHAFKVYHSAKTFYFAAESQDALNQWVEFIRQAALHPSFMSHTVNGHSQGHEFGAHAADVNTKDLFSETDSSGEESESMISKNLCTPSPQAGKEAGCSVFGSHSTAKSTSTPTSSTKHERGGGYLGSLRKLTKGSLHFKSSTSEKKSSSDIPVPTEQYRSYRKVPGGSFGIQIGTNTPGYHDTSMSMSTLSSPIAITTSSSAFHVEQGGAGSGSSMQRKLSISSSRSSIVSNSDSTAYLGPPSSPAPTLGIVPNHNSIQMSPSGLPLHPTQLVAVGSECDDGDDDKSIDSPGKSMKKIPYNFIHASNPNLVEFDFQTSKTLDYSLPKINSANSWDAPPSIQGFVTLKDLMLQKQEEDAQEMYNNRVLLGVEKKYEHKRHHGHRRHDSRTTDSVQGCGNGSVNCTGTGPIKLSKTQSRSLPKTPDYEISFKPDDEDIRRTRTKEGLKLRDFGYELISGDEPLGPVGISTGSCTGMNSNSSTTRHNMTSGEHGQFVEHGTWSAAMKTRQFLKSQQFLPSSTHKGKKHSSNSCSSTSSADFGGEKRAGSLKKKSKLSSDRIFQFNKHSSNHASGMVMTLPHNKKSNLDTSATAGGCSGGGIKKSHTYNNDLKDKAGVVKYEAHRKNSAPMPIFSKLSFSAGSSGGCGGGGAGAGIGNSGSTNNNKIPKEKRILGSPLLHRTIFGQHPFSSASGTQANTPVSTPTCTGREYDREIFSQVIFPKVPNHHHLHHTNQHNQQQQSHHCREPASRMTSIESNAPTPEYPNMECPPVFEPEIYSLTADPNASLSFLRRNNSANTEDK